MALDNVVEDIVAQAEKESREIISEGEKEAKSILDNAKKQVKEETKEFDDETDRLIEEMEKTESSSTNTLLKRQVLKAKEHVIEELYSQVMQKISELKGAERKKLIEAMLDRAKEELGSISTIYCNEQDKSFVNDAKVADINGIIAENKDGTIRVNYTFPVLLSRLKEETLNEIAKKIFQD
ncbi:hypothetical protein EPN87_01105 [archaeon]|nr:MAG: hypothetical protein EPN87_01105 [archaeon]